MDVVHPIFLSLKEKRLRKRFFKQKIVLSSVL